MGRKTELNEEKKHPYKTKINRTKTKQVVTKKPLLDRKNTGSKNIWHVKTHSCNEHYRSFKTTFKRNPENH